MNDYEIDCEMLDSKILSDGEMLIIETGDIKRFASALQI